MGNIVVDGRGPSEGEYDDIYSLYLEIPPTGFINGALPAHTQGKEEWRGGSLQRNGDTHNHGRIWLLVLLSITGSCTRVLRYPESQTPKLYSVVACC